MKFIETVLFMLDSATVILTVFRSFLTGKKQVVISFAMQIVFLFLFYIKGNATAVAVTMVTIIVLICKMRKLSILHTVIFIVTYIFVGIVTLKNIYDVLLVIANILNVFSIYYNSRNEVKSKGFLIGFGLCWTVFDLLLGLYGAMLSAILTTLTSSIAFFKLRTGKED